MILVTGAAGFIGRHVVEALSRRAGTSVVAIDVDSPPDALADALASTEAIFHLAGVNRPEREEEFAEGNSGLTESLCATLSELGRTPIVIFTSSTQAALDNPYGRSKLQAEKALERWGESSGAPVAIFRLPNAFGKWSRPNYNSVVATFGHNAAHGLPFTVSDPERELELAYIDEIVAALLGCLDDPPRGCERREVAPTFRVTVGELAERILAFADTRRTLLVPDFTDPLDRRLYATYLSHVPPEELAYSLKTSADERGVLGEMLKQPGFGQIFVSHTHPGITRGNHYHHTKTEKFLVVEGEAVVRLRDIRGGPVVEHRVTGEGFRVVDIAPGYTHSITNVGESELVTLFWANEVFDPERTDTYYLPVDPE